MTDDLTRRLAAVWFADIVGYSTLSEQDEDTALAAVGALQELAGPLVEAAGGRVVKFLGDGVLAEFPSADGAVRSALELRDAYAVAIREQRSGASPGESREGRPGGSGAEAAGPGTALRVGVHVGEVVTAPDGDIYGDGVNVAARIQGEAAPGRVVVSAAVEEQIRQRAGFHAVPLRGLRRLKGLRRQHRLYVVDREGGRATSGRAAPSFASGRPVAVGLTTAVVAFLALTLFVALKSAGDGGADAAGTDTPAPAPASVPALTPAERADASRRLGLGIEYFYTGDHAAAAEVLAPFAEAPLHGADGAREALRYLARARLEGGDDDAAGYALERLLDLEPPLALLIPAVETDALMDLYYRARRDHVRTGAVAGAGAPSRGLLIFDFRVAATEGSILGEEERTVLGPMLADMLWTDLSLQGVRVVDIEKMSFADRGDDAYAALELTLRSDSGDAPSHALMGTLAVRGDEALLSAWVFELGSGALTTTARVIGSVEELTLLPELLAERLSAALGGG